jgi:hypothetical protein
LFGVGNQELSTHIQRQSRRGKKLLAVWSWFGEGQQDYCIACRSNQEQAAKQYDCSGCGDRCPELLPVNRAVWRIWQLINTQWRVNAFALVGLDYPAVFQIAEVYGWEITPAIYEKLRILEIHELDRHRKEDGDDSGKSDRD